MQSSPEERPILPEEWRGNFTLRQVRRCKGWFDSSPKILAEERLTCVVECNAYRLAAHRKSCGYTNNRTVWSNIPVCSIKAGKDSNPRSARISVVKRARAGGINHDLVRHNHPGARAHDFRNWRLI